MLCKRLLSFLCSLLLSAVAVGQNNKPQTTVPDSCLVTNAADRPFIPPAPYRAKPSPGQFWYGTDKLWTALPVTGTWSGLPHYTPGDPTYRAKLPFLATKLRPTQGTAQPDRDWKTNRRTSATAPERGKRKRQLDKRRPIHHDGYQLPNPRVLGDHRAL